MDDIVNPQDAELEEIVLGACLIESKAITLVAGILRPEVFYIEKNREIYAALQSMYRAGQVIDLMTVKEELTRRGKLDFIGGPYALVSITTRVASSAHLEYHARILQQKYIRREAILGFHKLLAQAADETTDIADTLADAHTLLDQLEKECGMSEHLRSMLQLMEDTVELIETRVASNKNGVTGLPTGFNELNRLTCGWQPGDLIIVAARPSVGKTAFALHLARAAASAGYHIAVYSLEMQGERLGDRWLMAACNINPYRWRNGIPNPQEVAEARTTASGLAQLPIYVDDSSSVSMDHIRSSARLLKSRKQCDMIIIDYLQLCDMSTKQVNRNREQEVAQATRKAKLLAKELHIPVVLLSQLNRESENRPGGRPELAHLRESGAIEQDADIVILLYRPAMLHIPTDRESGYPTEGLGVAIVAKQRNGETGNVYFGHNQSITKFYDYVPPMEYLNKYAK